ncbi:DUF4395 family protein [Streptomyces sp. Ncost-T10-10d]|uniref:DUF4395 family protein n=1 Tax=Streptomyces sp. Ncost-T10-10d TaxID=1839774 RepID=UPI000B86DD93
MPASSFAFRSPFSPQARRPATGDRLDDRGRCRQGPRGRESGGTRGVVGLRPGGRVGYLDGAAPLGPASAALALAAAILNAAFGYCPGGEMYLFIPRFRSA